ncbi:MAG: LPS assembly lipoprotein LptE [Alphaproteobacteria bacterium]
MAGHSVINGECEGLRPSRTFFLVFLAILLLTGCGFHPLYARGDTAGAPAAQHLAQVRIPPIGDRIGQQLRNYLFDRMTPLGQPPAARYMLEIDLDKSVQDLGIRKDATATRANMVVSASFRLRSETAEKQPILFAGTTRSVASYNILDAQYATIVSEKDAEVRAVRQVADDIISRLAIYFTTPRAESPR